MRKRYVALLAAFTALFGSIATARDLGVVSDTDSRVRYYNYDPEEIYYMKGYYGFVTTVFFREDEEIQTISAGDAEAWDVTVAGNRDFIFVKPVMEPSRRTNLTVITDRRTYVFDLEMGELEDGASAIPSDLAFKVRFNYPEPPVARVRQPDEDALAAQREAEERRLAEERAQREREEAEAKARADEARREAQERRQRMLDRLRAPSVIFDETEEEEPAQEDGQPRDFRENYQERIVSGRSDDTVFLDDAATRRFSGAEAYRVPDLESKVIQGSLIMGTLETAIDTTLTGMLRASVSEDVWSADASKVLIPRGSRLVGQYRSAVQFGTSRVLIAWTRVIRPDGVSVDLGSPGTDSLGRAGLSGFADSHWATRFGTAALISVIEGGSIYALAQIDDDIQRDSADDLSSNANDNFGRLLEPYINIPTTVHVDQGAQIIIFVARDLDFSTAGI